jgi:hypothetical protein
MRTEFRRCTRFWQKISRFQGTCDTVRKRLKKTRTDTQLQFYKAVDRPSLLYGSETWVTTQRDMTRLEAAEMRFLRSVTGYTRLDKIRSDKKRTRDLWNTRRETQIQTNLDQPPWKNEQNQTSETRPQLQTLRKNRSWKPQKTMAMRRCMNRSNELIHGGRWWLLLLPVTIPVIQHKNIIKRGTRSNSLLNSYS